MFQHYEMWKPLLIDRAGAVAITLDARSGLRLTKRAAKPTAVEAKAGRSLRFFDSCVNRFEACSAFTYVTACMLAKSPK